MSRERSTGRHVPVEMDEARCPECGNESGNVQYEREGDIRRHPSGKRFKTVPTAASRTDVSTTAPKLRRWFDSATSPPPPPG